MVVYKDTKSVFIREVARHVILVVVERIHLLTFSKYFTDVVKQGIVHNCIKAALILATTGLFRVGDLTDLENTGCLSILSPEVIADLRH